MSTSHSAESAGEQRPRSFSDQLVQQEGTPLSWKAVAKRSIAVVITGVVLYLVAPSLIAEFHSWPRLSSVNPIWFVIVLAAEIAHFGCTFALQRIALRTRAWFPVITAQLAGNAISRIVPGGAAAGAAVQFRMLAVSGMDTADTVGGLTAFSLLGIAGLLVLPVLVLPAVVFGAPISSGLYTAAVLGAVAFVLFAGFGTLVAATDTPIRVVASAVQGVRNRLVRKRAPMVGLSKRLLDQRDLILSVLGKQWWQATLLSLGRLALDFLCLYAAVRAVGSHPRVSQVMLVYAVVGVIGLIPITPGGIGIIEASMTGLLVLVGVSAAQAVLATLAYRLASYWLPLMAGPFAYTLFKLRYRPDGRLVS